MASREARTFVLVAIGMLVLAGMFVWALAAPADPEVTAPLAARPPPPPPAAPAAPAASPPVAAVAQPATPAETAPRDPDAIDLFAAAMPEWMAEQHARVTAGKWLDVTRQKEAYNYGQEHKDDARPQMLLAWDSMNREWWGFAVRLYTAAYDADPQSKHDVTMLRDVLEIASRHDRVENREATALIQRAYGKDALPKIELKLEELRRSGEVTRVGRLERLRNAILER